MIHYVIKELSNLMSVIIKVEIFNKMINLPNLISNISSINYDSIMDIMV